MVVDALSDAVTLKPEQIAKWGDRQRGIGFDQLLMVAPPSAADCDFDYLIFNADGGEAEQCGNGTRCVTDFVHRRGLTQQTQLSWNSKGGIVRTAIHDDGMIETWLPEPQFQYARVPFQHSEADRPPGQCVALETEHGEVQIVPVSLGNPHGVVFVDDVIELDVAGIGHALSHHEAFPERANIGFCQIVNKGFIRLRVFERGASETQACGSGASAAVAVGCQTGQLNSKVKVSLPGGKLRVEWPNSKGLIKLVGDSTFVYNGQLDI